MKILVVEDEARVAAAINRSLKAEGYQVESVADSSRALNKCREVFDLIIMDRMLPGPFDGLQIIGKIRSEGVETPVLMLTALGEVTDRVEGLSAGADDYLVKPFSIKELLARVKVLLRRPKRRIGTVIKIGSLEINTLTSEVRRKGKSINLSKREFKLLNYLAFHQGKIVSKDTLINHVWDADAIIMTNTVEVYIGYLRKKIDKDFPGEPPLIQTVYGFGYRIGEDEKDV